MTPDQIEAAAKALFERESAQYTTRMEWGELAEETRQIWRYHVVKRQAREEALEEAAQGWLERHGDIDVLGAASFLRALKSEAEE